MQVPSKSEIMQMVTLGEKEYSKETAGLLINKDLQFDDEASLILFLAESGTIKTTKRNWFRASFLFALPMNWIQA